MNLSRKIAIYFAIVIVVSCSGLGIYSILSSTNTVMEGTEESLELLANEGAERVEAELENQLIALEELSLREEVRTMDIDTQRDALRDDAQRLDFLDIGVVEPDGYTNYILDEEADAELGDRDYVQRGFEGEPNVSDVIISRVIDDAVVMYAVPIYDLDNEDEVVGVLIARGYGDILTEITDDIRYGDEGYSYIIGEDGTLFAHPNRNYIMEQANIFDDEYEEGIFEELSETFDELGIGNEGVINYEMDGEERYAGVVNVPSTNWMLAVGSFEEEVLSGQIDLRNGILMASFLLIIIGAGAGLFIGKAIASPVNQVTNLSQKIAELDFTKEVSDDLLNRKDEVGSLAGAFKEITENLKDFAKRLAEQAEQLASSSEELSANTEENKSASEEVSKAVEEIAEGASNQAEKTEQASNNTEEFGKMIDNDQEHVKKLGETIEEVTNLKEDGLKTVETLTQKTEENNKASESIYNVIKETKDSADNIGEATEAIKDIAEQTNLLALNASIEAARAGEAGQGFDVVANEIRKLAENANENSEKISNIVKELNEKSNTAVNTMEEVQGIVTEQNQGVENTKDKFNEIAESIQRVKEIADSLNETGQQMQEKKQEIMENLQSLASTAQESSSSTEEISSSVEEQTASMDEIAKSSEQLANLAEQMQNIVSNFKY